MKKLQALSVAAASMLVLAGEALAQGATPPANAPVGGLVGLGVLAAAVAAGGYIALRKK